MACDSDDPTPTPFKIPTTATSKCKGLKGHQVCSVCPEGLALWFSQGWVMSCCLRAKLRSDNLSRAHSSPWVGESILQIPGFISHLQVEEPQCSVNLELGTSLNFFFLHLLSSGLTNSALCAFASFSGSGSVGGENTSLEKCIS